MPTTQRPHPGAAPAPIARGPEPTSPALPAAILALALGGLAVAIDLWLIHFRVHSGGGGSSFCDLSERVSCSDVARSSWSSLLGVPQAAWGALSYLTVAGLAISALVRRRPGSTWPAGLLLAGTSFMVAWSVFLAGISELVIRKFCYMCSISWGVNVALLAVSAVLARRAGGAVAAFRADVRTLRASPLAGGIAGAVVVAAGLVLLLTRGFSPAAVAIAPSAQGAVIPVGAPGSLVIYEYSDYLCPFCARMHAEEKAIVARRPDVRLVHRYFPLEATCNPAVRTTVHEGACDLARGGICAEKQGRVEAYDDAAFASQASHPGPDEVASQIGLDPVAFRACLSAPETQQQLASDVQSANALGVSFTPAFLVQGKVMPAEKLLQALGLAGQISP